MGGCPSRPQAAPPLVPVPEDIDTPRVVLQVAVAPDVEAAIQRALANESATILWIECFAFNPRPLTVNDTRHIIACLRETPRINTLDITHYSLHDPAALNVLRDGLPLCTAVTTVALWNMHLTNEELDHLRPAFYNTSITKLDLTGNDIQGQRGGEVLRDLLVGNDTLRELILSFIHIGPEVAIGFGQGLTDNHVLQILHLEECHIGNEGLANLLPAEGIINNSLLELDLSWNSIEGEDGGRQVSLLLSRFTALKVLDLEINEHLGPLGVRALAPGLAAASQLVELGLSSCGLGNDGIANLILDGQGNRSLMSLNISDNDIQGEDGGRQIALLLQCFTALKVLYLYNNNRLGPLGARALAPRLAAARHLETLALHGCGLGNDGVANLILPDGQVSRSLTKLDLSGNNIEGEDGGRQVSLLLSHCPSLKVLDLVGNDSLGPLGARALAPGLAAARHLETLNLGGCGLGNNGVANLVPDGQVNRSLTNLNLIGNDIQGLQGGENVVSLVARCTNLNSVDGLENILSPDQRGRLHMLLDRKRMCTVAQALGGSPFPVLFRAVEEAHRHEHGLSAIFVILQNDGDDYFCTANNRAVE